MPPLDQYHGLNRRGHCLTTQVALPALSPRSKYGFEYEFVSSKAVVNAIALPLVYSTTKAQLHRL